MVRFPQIQRNYDSPNKDKINALFWISIIGVLVFRLYQWRNLTTPVVDYGLDDVLYLKLAQKFYWGYEYGSLAFVRRPGFPLYIAVLHSLGISFAFVQKATYLSCIAGFSFIANRLRTNKLITLATATLCTYHPHAPAVLLRVTPDGFYSLCIAIGLIGLGLSAIYSKNTTRYIFLLFAGFALGMAYSTREEHILITVLLLSVCGLHLSTTKNLKQTIVRFAFPLAIATAVFPLTFSTINNYKFGQFSLSEFSSKSFQSLYQASLSIPQSDDLKGVPLSSEGLEALFQISSTWNELKPHFEIHSNHWAKLTSSFTGNPKEVGAGAFPWLLKDVANAVNTYETPQSADQFYTSLAGEIRLAQDEGKIGRRSPVISQLDPNILVWLPRFFSSLLKLGGQMVYPPSIIVPYSADNSEVLKRLYGETLNQPTERADIVIHKAKASGWMYQNNGRILSFKVVSQSEELLYEFVSFTNRDDVFEIRKGFNPQRDSGFSFEMDFVGMDTSGARFVFVTEKHGEVSIPLPEFLRSGSSLLQQHGINFHLDTLDLDASISDTVIPAASAGKIYLIGLSFLTLASFVALGFRIHSGSDWNQVALIWVLTISSWILLRLILCSLLDATAYPCTPRYLFAASFPLPWVIACLSALKPRATNELRFN